MYKFLNIEDIFKDSLKLLKTKEQMFVIISKGGKVYGILL